MSQHPCSRVCKIEVRNELIKGAQEPVILNDLGIMLPSLGYDYT